MLDHPRYDGAKRLLRRSISSARMHRLDAQRIPANSGELRLFMVMRNEVLRLPYFLAYYFGRGVDRMFVLDNASTDDSKALLLEQERVHLFSSAEHYDRQEAWVDVLLRRFGRGHWCLVVDADEFLVLPHEDALSLRDVTAFLEEEGASALRSLLVDMYPRGPLRDAVYHPGDNPVEVGGYFDPGHVYVEEPYPFRACTGEARTRTWGGTRERVFGRHVCCSKFPLLRYAPGLFLTRGAHAVEGAHVSALSGALLHFRYFSDFIEHCAEEAVRGAHWQGAREYQAYHGALSKAPELRMDAPDSLRYVDWHSLDDAGLFRIPPAFAQRAAR